eukprot:2682623-Rhodomonas_salina.3
MQLEVSHRLSRSKELHCGLTWTGCPPPPGPPSLKLLLGADLSPFNVPNRLPDLQTPDTCVSKDAQRTSTLAPKTASLRSDASPRTAAPACALLSRGPHCHGERMTPATAFLIQIVLKQCLASGCISV